MLLRLYKKMLNNRWLVFCLLIGLVLAVAVMSCVPIYSNGILQRMLVKDLEMEQVTTGNYPGAYIVDKTFATSSGKEKEKNVQYYEFLDKKITQELYPQIGLPVIAKNFSLTNDLMVAVDAEDTRIYKSTRSLKVETFSEIEKHVKITRGKLPAKEKVGDSYEVMVSEAALQNLNLNLGKTYILTGALNEKSAGSIKVKVVGIYTNKEKVDPYWVGGSWQKPGSIVMNYEAFTKQYLQEKASTVTGAHWYYAFDYHQIKITDLEYLIPVLNSHTDALKYYQDLQFSMKALPTLQKYQQREGILKTTLWILQIPILMMLIFYLFMMSQLIIGQEKNEIAVLKSRGASRRQIINSYFMQGLVLSGIALIIGPPIGLLLCKLLGASNGFLEFVSRTGMPLSLNLKAYGYSLVAVGVFIITMLIPVYFATGKTIVQHKQGKARSTGKGLWQKYFLDIVLLAVSLYGLRSYKMRQSIVSITGAQAAALPIDPLLFLISTLFILSVGLVFLRVFPFIVKLIFWLGRRFWNPAAYASLIGVSRSNGQDQFLMLFLILTISIGIFNANAARTINSNMEQRERYSVGADIAIQGNWGSNGREVMTASSDAGSGNFDSFAYVYEEPPFEPYTKLKGVEQVTKVFKRKNVQVDVKGKSGDNVYLMGITPNEFGKVAWFNPTLLSHHWYEYLNLMAKDVRACLVSTNMKNELGAKVGDEIFVKWGPNFVPCVIYGFVDYWPSYNPYESKGGQKQSLVVANFSYIQAMTRLEPYEVWAKQKPGTKSEDIYNDIKAKQIPIMSIKNANQQVISQKNDPMLQGTNGELTLGFIVTMIISIIGFLIYWILSIQGRTLQFGIFRAMGLTLKEVIGMLLCEQVLISGTSIIMGIIIGGITSDLFVPLLQMLHSPAEQILPFKVVAYGGDFIKLYMIIALMLVGGFIVLGRLISKIKISQAIKLGED